MSYGKCAETIDLDAMKWLPLAALDKECSLVIKPTSWLCLPDEPAVPGLSQSHNAYNGCLDI